MKYNPEMNRCRGTDPRVLTEMLGSQPMAEPSCGCRTRGVGRSACGGRMNGACRTAGSGSCCEHASDPIGARAEAGGHCNEALASACAGEPSLAMVYSPHQIFDNVYSPEDALANGTLFAELNKPWKAGGTR